MHRVTRSFAAAGRARPILSDVDLVVYPGETVAAVGPSGSGKTTLLQIAAGIDRADAGTVEWPTLSKPLRPAQIGMAFQGQSLLAPLTVLENTVFPMLIARRDPRDAEERALEVLESFGVAAMRGALPSELSGGEAQRVAIARALVLSPPFVILDEPTGQLDRATAAFCIDAVMHECERTGAALLVATHDRAVSERLDRRVELRAGHVRMESPPCSA